MPEPDKIPLNPTKYVAIETTDQGQASYLHLPSGCYMREVGRATFFDTFDAAQEAYMQCMDDSEARYTVMPVSVTPSFA